MTITATVFTSRALALLFFALVPGSAAYRHITRRDIIEGKVEIVPEEEQPYVLAPKSLEAGDIATIVRRDRKSRVDPESMLIGLPPKVTELFSKYVHDSGLMEIFHDLMYKDPVKRGGNKVYDLQDGTKWSARTSNNWVLDGDMTWIDPANEWTYEFILNVWREGGFDQVLDTLGEKFGTDGLWLDGTSFIIVSNFNGNNLHHDLPESGSKVFNIIFPINIPEKGDSQLLVAERENFSSVENATPINFQKDVGVLVGGDSIHGTGNCDYRENKEFRLAIAVYFIDVNEENVEDFGSDDTAYYPPVGSEEFLLAQRGRHWNPQGNHSLISDFGRVPMEVEDDNEENCEYWAQKGMCDDSLEIRNQCLNSCRVFLENEEYYDHLARMLKWPTEKASLQTQED